MCVKASNRILITVLVWCFYEKTMGYPGNMNMIFGNGSKAYAPYSGSIRKWPRRSLLCSLKRSVNVWGSFSPTEGILEMGEEADGPGTSLLRAPIHHPSPVPWHIVAHPGETVDRPAFGKVLRLRFAFSAFAIFSLKQDILACFCFP